MLLLLSRNETPQGSDAKTRNVSSRLAMTAAAKTKTQIIGARNGGRCSLGPLKRASNDAKCRNFPVSIYGVSPEGMRLCDEYASRLGCTLHLVISNVSAYPRP